MFFWRMSVKRSLVGAGLALAWLGLMIFLIRVLFDVAYLVAAALMLAGLILAAIGLLSRR